MDTKKPPQHPRPYENKKKLILENLSVNIGSILKNVLSTVHESDTHLK